MITGTVVVRLTRVLCVLYLSVLGTDDSSLSSIVHRPRAVEDGAVRMGTEDLPPPLSAQNKSSFAYYTINARLPVILARIADSLCRKRERIIAKYGQESSEDIKFVIGRLSKLRYEVQTDKPIQPLESDALDVEAWNKELAEQTAARDGEPPKWYSATWLYVECHMYRALNDYVALTKTMKSFDIFGEQKQLAYTDAEVPVSSLMSYLDEVTTNLQKGTETDVDELFSEFVQVALWGNKCDLSISQGADNSQKQCLLEQLSHLKPNILANDTTETLAALRGAAAARSHQPGRADIVLDNAGFELVTDLTFAEVLLATGLASCVHFHGKTMPWFVSDVTQDDFSWTLDAMSASSNAAVSKFGTKWKSRLQDGSWVYKAHPFWTLPYDYSLMKKHAPDLYGDLAQADLVFFKGDLNYRKLVGDRDWNPTTPFKVSLRGFHPAPLCSLRALKADTVAGLQPGVSEEVAAKDEKWQVNGNWATISFCGDRLSGS